MQQRGTRLSKPMSLSHFQRFLSSPIELAPFPPQLLNSPPFPPVPVELIPSPSQLLNSSPFPFPPLTC